jgi:excisionase family DNA binding protein
MRHRQEDGVMVDDRLLTPEAVADKLGIAPLTVVRWLRAGKLPGRKFGRKFWRVRPEELEAFINEVPTLAQVAHALGSLPSFSLGVEREGEDWGQALGQARAALVTLIQLLFPLGQPISPRTAYGWQAFPLAQINGVLAREGLVIHAAKTPGTTQEITCTDAHGRVEQYGLFELRRLKIAAT